MARYLKFFFFLFIMILLTFNVFSLDSVMTAQPDSLAFDSLINSVFDSTATYTEKDIQIYLYHVNALLEFQDIQIRKYQSFLYISIGIISVIVSLIILKWLSVRYEKSFKVIKVKKHEMVPAATLKMIFKHWHINESLKSLQQKLSDNNGEEMNLNKFISFAKEYGMECNVIKSGINDMMKILYIPVIVIFPNHMAILYKTRKERILLADSYYGHLELNPYYFVNNWYTDRNKETGIFVTMIPGKLHNKSTRKVSEMITQLNKLDKKSWSQYSLI